MHQNKTLSASDAQIDFESKMIHYPIEKGKSYLIINWIALLALLKLTKGTKYVKSLPNRDFYVTLLVFNLHSSCVKSKPMITQ